MNKLIRGAYFSPEAAREQRLRSQLRGEDYGPRDIRNYDWVDVASRLRLSDPEGIRLAEIRRYRK